MRIHKTITRFVGRWGWQGPPWAQEVKVHLVQAGLDGEHWLICTPWACLNAPNKAETTEFQMTAALGPHAFDREQEALDHANAKAPHWHRKDNQVVSGRAHDATRWHGELVGVGGLSDATGLTREELYTIARGEKKATKKQAELALSYKGKAV
jgi:hypothetical protein